MVYRQPSFNLENMRFWKKRKADCQKRRKHYLKREIFHFKQLTRSGLPHRQPKSTEYNTQNYNFFVVI